MQTTSTILITGAAGFIASCMASFLNQKGYTQLYLVDDFSQESKTVNHSQIQCIEKIQRDDIKAFLERNIQIDYVIHFGARTDTTEMDYSIHEVLNLNYSKIIWNYCTLKNIPLIYASSAATYGNGEYGYEDNHTIVNQLQPLNPYGVSKNEFDKWALLQTETPLHWYGLKFFNVYGPNEYHKGRMASVIFHAFHQIKDNKALKLFRSHNPDYSDGGQMRDFIYVMDILEVSYWLMQNSPENGLYNLGTGQAATYNQLAKAIFDAMDLQVTISYIDTPIDIRDKYQYYTEANMSKLIQAGYTKPFTPIELGVKDYISQYLNTLKIY
jgi:ADP-L-glycero-D-manno-heptose 6-epimerase